MLHRNQLRPTQRCSAAQTTFSNLLISSSRSVSVGRATPSSQRAHLKPTFRSIGQWMYVRLVRPQCNRRRSFRFLLSNGLQGLIHSLCKKDGKGHSICSGLKIWSCYSVFSQWWRFHTSLFRRLFKPTCHYYVVHQCPQWICNLVLLLYENVRSISFSPQQCSDMLVSLCSDVQYIHISEFLHNDLKLDNVVLGNSVSGKLTLLYHWLRKKRAPYVTKGRTYSLTNAEINIYKKGTSTSCTWSARWTCSAINIHWYFFIRKNYEVFVIL